MSTETMIPTPSKAPAQPTTHGDFFSAAEARVDRWRQLGAVTRAWQTAVGRGRPQWLSAGGKDLSVVVSGLPNRQDIDANINEQLIVELYSK